MRQHILCELMIALISLSFSVNTVSAGPFEDGLAAADRGDYPTAVDLLRPLAEQGDARLTTGHGTARAQFALGLRYEYGGRGVTPDYGKALEWYHLAAMQGDAEAQFSLGRMYENGKGSTQDYKKAVEWYRLAAKQGYADAQDFLGTMFRLERGVTQDFVRAHMWYNLAAAQGTNYYAPKQRELISQQMTPQQIAEAQAMARKCEASKYKDCD